MTQVQYHMNLLRSLLSERYKRHGVSEQLPSEHPAEQLLYLLGYADAKRESYGMKLSLEQDQEITAFIKTLCGLVEDDEVGILAGGSVAHVWVNDERVAPFYVECLLPDAEGHERYRARLSGLGTYLQAWGEGQYFDLNKQGIGEWLYRIGVPFLPGSLWVNNTDDEDGEILFKWAKPGDRNFVPIPYKYAWLPRNEDGGLL